MNLSYKSTIMYITIISFCMSGLFIGLGFYKMFAYKNSSYDYVNAYVGGDAYNYIINSNYSVAYFVLATLFVILGVGMLIIYNMRKEQ